MKCIIAMMVIFILITQTFCTLVYVSGSDNEITADTGVDEVAPIGKLGK